LNSLSGWKGLKKFIPRDSFNSSLYILFSMFKTQTVETMSTEHGHLYLETPMSKE